MAAPVVAYRPNGLAWGAALLWIIVGSLALAAALSGSGSPVWAWMSLATAPVWVLFSLRSDVFVGHGWVIVRRGFRRWEEPLEGLEVSLRGSSLRLSRDGRVVAATLPTHSAFVNEEATKDPERVVAAIRAAIRSAEADRPAV